MWELLANGVSLAANASGLYTFASGFSVDRNNRQIQASVDRVERLLETHLHGSAKHSDTVDRLAATISQFVGHPGFVERQHFQAAFVQLSRQIAGEIAQHFLSEVRNEMRTVQESVRVSHGSLVHAPSHLLHAILRDPFGAGMTRVWDISAAGLASVDRPVILTPQFAPISWINPGTQQTFLGEMPFRSLRGYGLSVRAPEYRHMADGHIFSERHGLYVPRDFLFTGSVT